MRKLLSSFRSPWRQSIFLNLLVGLTFIGATAYGQSPAGGPNQAMTLTDSADGAKRLVSQTEFIYQGQLRENGMPADGVYDIQFVLYPSQTGGSELGSSVHEGIAVINGQFTAKLDFGRVAFDSKESWLEVAVRHGFSADAYTALSPRQRLTPAPYAILAQRQAWSLIGVPVGFVERASATKTVDQHNDNEQRKDETSGEETTTPLAALGAANFLVKFNASGNPAGQSIIYDNGGNVGIGTTNPQFQLSLGPSLADTKLALYENGANNSYGLGVRPGSFRFHLNGSGARYAFFDSDGSGAKEIVTIQGIGRVGIGTADPQAALDVKGRIVTEQIIGNAAFFNSLGCFFCDNVAVQFEIAGGAAIEPGMVVAIDSASAGGLRLADKAYDRTVAGIVSGANETKPGLLMNQKNAADGSLPLALTGRAYCWADASNGPINPGDPLTTSNTPGHAMKVTDSTKAQGAIIGKALTSLTEGRGLVLVLVTLQ